MRIHIQCIILGSAAEAKWRLQQSYVLCDDAVISFLGNPNANSFVINDVQSVHNSTSCTELSYKVCVSLFIFSFKVFINNFRLPTSKCSVQLNELRNCVVLEKLRLLTEWEMKIRTSEEESLMVPFIKSKQSSVLVWAHFFLIFVQLKKVIWICWNVHVRFGVAVDRESVVFQYPTYTHTLSP